MKTVRLIACLAIAAGVAFAQIQIIGNTKIEFQRPTINSNFAYLDAQNQLKLTNPFSAKGQMIVQGIFTPVVVNWPGSDGVYCGTWTNAVLTWTACPGGGGGGSGTVNSGTSGQFAKYSSTGTVVGGATIAQTDLPADYVLTATSGSGTAYTGTLPAGVTITGCTLDEEYILHADVANTGAATATWGGCSATLKKYQGTADLVANDIRAASDTTYRFNGVYMLMTSQSGNAAAAGGPFQAPITGGPCASGNHVSDINATTGAITCTADSGGGGVGGTPPYETDVTGTSINITKATHGKGNYPEVMVFQSGVYVPVTYALSSGDVSITALPSATYHVVISAGIDGSGTSGVTTGVVESWPMDILQGGQLTGSTGNVPLTSAGRAVATRKMFRLAFSFTKVCALASNSTAGHLIVGMYDALGTTRLAQTEIAFAAAGASCGTIAWSGQAGAYLIMASWDNTTTQYFASISPFSGTNVVPLLNASSPSNPVSIYKDAAWAGTGNSLPANVTGFSVSPGGIYVPVLVFQ